MFMMCERGNIENGSEEKVEACEKTVKCFKVGKKRGG